MARVTAAGFSGFNADLFRSAIKSTMLMGSPNIVEEKVTFIWTIQKTFAKTDNKGKAWTKDATPTTVVEHDPVLVDCAVEFIPRTTLSGGTAIGPFDTPRAIITILDVDFELVSTADRVLMGNNTYVVDFVAPPVGLFEVDVYSIHVSAVDEV